MTCEHAGHDQDCAETECPHCREIIHDQAAHHCLPIGWIDSWQLIGNPPEAYIPLTADQLARRKEKP